MQKYRQVRDEFTEFKKKAAQYQGAVYELAKSASQSSRRLGMLTNTILALRKHFSAEPHLDECSFNDTVMEGTKVECTCGHDAILESIDKALAEPDWDPGNVKVEIKDHAEEATNAEVPDVGEFAPPPPVL
jgi:hypothetical protein